MFEIHFKFKPHALTVIALVLLVPWLILGSCRSYTYFSSRIRSTAGKHHAVIHQGRPGPWGKLLYTEMVIGVPDEFVSLPALATTNTWTFKKINRNEVVALIRSTDLPPAQIDALINATPWSIAVNGTVLTPSDTQVLALTPASRARIYSALLECQGNSEAKDPVWFNPEMLDRMIGQSNLQPASIALLRSLLYRIPGSSLYFFADTEVALRQLPDDRERRRFIQLISAKASLLVRLQVDESSDVDAMAEYWGRGGRVKDVLPLMRALQDVENGWDLSLSYLLPPLARDRLYTYPFPNPSANVTKEDCFWTAFNIFSSAPDNRFVDMDFVRKNLDKDYYSIYEPSQLGDIVFLATADGSVIHAATHVADDIVFTKNGYHYTQPWLMMHRKDMLETYVARYPGKDSLRFLYFRKKTI